MFHSSSWNCLWSWCGFYGHLSYFFPWSPFGSPLKGNFLEVGHWFFLPSSLLQKLCSLLLVQFLLAHPSPPPPPPSRKKLGSYPIALYISSFVLHFSYEGMLFPAQKKCLVYPCQRNRGISLWNREEKSVCAQLRTMSVMTQGWFRRALQQL